MHARTTSKTDLASRHHATFCGPLTRKVSVTFDNDAGCVTFLCGECAVLATENLFTLIASPARRSSPDKVQQSATRYPGRFTFR